MAKCTRISKLGPTSPVRDRHTWMKKARRRENGGAVGAYTLGPEDGYDGYS